VVRKERRLGEKVRKTLKKNIMYTDRCMKNVEYDCDM
jgi:hypothetical protein